MTIQYVALGIYLTISLLLLAGHARRLQAGSGMDRFASVGICFGWPLIVIGGILIVPLFWLVERIDQLEEQRNTRRKERR